MHVSSLAHCQLAMLSHSEEVAREWMGAQYQSTGAGVELS